MGFGHHSNITFSRVCHFHDMVSKSFTEIFGLSAVNMFDIAHFYQLRRHYGHVHVVPERYVHYHRCMLCKVYENGVKTVLDNNINKIKKT